MFIMLSTCGCMLCGITFCRSWWCAGWNTWVPVRMAYSSVKRPVWKAATARARSRCSLSERCSCVDDNDDTSITRRLLLPGYCCSNASHIQSTWSSLNRCTTDNLQYDKCPLWGDHNYDKTFNKTYHKTQNKSRSCKTCTTVAALISILL